MRRVRFHQKDKPITTQVIPHGLGNYCLVQTVGTGRGGPIEPVIRADFTTRELQDFCVDVLGMIAVEENRV